MTDTDHNQQPKEELRPLVNELLRETYKRCIDYMHSNGSPTIDPKTMLYFFGYEALEMGRELRRIINDEEETKDDKFDYAAEVDLETTLTPELGKRIGQRLVALQTFGQAVARAAKKCLKGKSSPFEAGLYLDWAACDLAESLSDWGDPVDIYKHGVFDAALNELEQMHWDALGPEHRQKHRDHMKGYVKSAISAGVISGFELDQAGRIALAKHMTELSDSEVKAILNPNGGGV